MLGVYIYVTILNKFVSFRLRSKILNIKLCINRVSEMRIFTRSNLIKHQY